VWRERYDVVLHGEDAETAPATFDALAFIERTVAQVRAGALGRVDGVASSSDYPGCIVAAAIARELGLPGPNPQSVLRCSHKYYSRLAQQAAAPEATPRFALVDPQRLDPRAFDLPFPVFVKPVKGWFTQHARRIDTFADLAAFAASPEVRYHLTEFVAPFNHLLARYTDFAHDGSYLLAEELLGGVQVTVEGFVFGGEVEILGIIDSVMFPGTISFQRFDYPSALPEAVQERMAGIARRVMPRLGFDTGLFNVELFYDAAADRVSIIEVNPRMCGQFADLLESVNGTNTYEILFALAAGERPPPVRRGGRYQVAASFPLRAFGDQTVLRVPDARDVAAVKQAYPVTLVKTYYRAGQRLADEDQSDGYSYRYAVVNLAARDRPSLLADFAAVQQRLGFRFAD
jgi:hypothetical protein